MIDEKGARKLVGDIFGLSPEYIRSEVVKALEKELSSIKPRERIVLELVYGLKGTRTAALREIAPVIAVTSRERVRQVKDRALKRLRHPWHSTALKPYIADTPIADALTGLAMKKELRKQTDDEFKRALIEHAQSVGKRLEELSRKPLLVTYFVEVLEKLDNILEILQGIDKERRKD